jgi:hypothetical protein
VAQFGSAPALGAGGRRFKSGQPDGNRALLGSLREPFGFSWELFRELAFGEFLASFLRKLVGSTWGTPGRPFVLFSEWG